MNSSHSKTAMALLALPPLHSSNDNFLPPIPQFERIHTNSLINIEKTLSRLTTNFYNSDDINKIVTELRLTKTRRPTSFYKYSRVPDNRPPPDY